MTNVKSNFLRLAAVLLLLVSVMAIVSIETDAASWPATYNIKTYVTSTGNNTTVYQTPTSTAKYGTIYATDLITINGCYGSRLKVTYPIGNGRTKTGYVNASAVLKNGKPNYAMHKWVAKKQTNVYRRQTGNQTIGYADKNDTLWILYNDNSSSRLQLIYPVPGGYKMGWANRSDLVLAQTNNQSQTNKSISLNVPHYMQNDSRWGGVKIDTKTIGSVGCTTTCVAMIYSYKTNKTIYPDKMCKNYLRYRGNDLIWSSLTQYGFTREKCGDIRITNSILKKIYDKLKAGKPVIVGSYVSASSNKGHWIVVTGYNGSSTSSFSASDFIINDPSNSSRTTLQQFLNSYPYINSIVY